MDYFFPPIQVENVKQMSSFFLKVREQATRDGGVLVDPLLLLCIPSTGLQSFLKRLAVRHLQIRGVQLGSCNKFMGLSYFLNGLVLRR